MHNSTAGCSELETDGADGDVLWCVILNHLQDCGVHIWPVVAFPCCVVAVVLSLLCWLLQSKPQHGHCADATDVVFAHNTNHTVTVANGRWLLFFSWCTQMHLCHHHTNSAPTDVMYGAHPKAMAKIDM